MKQSIYLSTAEHARWKALGVSLGDVIRAGLDTLEADAGLPGASAARTPKQKPDLGVCTNRLPSEAYCKVCGQIHEGKRK
jgi:hypothetical protein